MLPTPDGVELLVRLVRTKSWSRGSKSQYAKLDACSACACSNHYLQSMPATARLWPASPAAFGLRFRRLLEVVLQTRHPFTVGSLRTGGATTLFRAWQENLPRLCWRGRWTDVNTLFHYVQELQATEISASFTVEVMKRVEALAALLPYLVAEWVAQEED